MPTLSVYAVSVAVGGWGSAIIIDKNISTLANVLKIITNFNNIYVCGSPG